MAERNVTGQLERIYQAHLNYKCMRIIYIYCRLFQDLLLFTLFLRRYIAGNGQYPFLLSEIIEQEGSLVDLPSLINKERHRCIERTQTPVVFFCLIEILFLQVRLNHQVWMTVLIPPLTPALGGYHILL